MNEELFQKSIFERQTVNTQQSAGQKYGLF